MRTGRFVGFVVLRLISIINEELICFQWFVLQFRSMEKKVEYNFSSTVLYNESAETNDTYYHIDGGNVFNVTFNVNVNGTIQNVTTGG